MKRSRRHSSSRTRILLLLGVAFAAVVAALFLIPGTPPPGRGTSSAADSPQLTIKAFMVATGIFAVPSPGQETADYLVGEAEARKAGQPLAHAIFVDTETFETRGWRDLIHVRRLPISRPPKIDFVREIALIVWPVAGQAPASVLQGAGLSIRAADVQQHGIAIQLGVSTGPMPATPVGGGGTLPYALITIPRDQWPIPVPPPDVPPLVVTLAK